MQADRRAALSPHADARPDATEGRDRTSGADLIARIAAALDVSPEAVSGAARSAGDRVQVLAENAELLRLFDQIGDRQARHACIAHVRSVLEGLKTRPSRD